MKRLAEQRAEKFYQLRQEGMTDEEIASMYFLASARVYQIIAKYERKLHPTRTPHKTSTKADFRAKEFRDLRLRGATLEDIANTYSLTRQRIDQAIKRYERKYDLPSCTALSKEITRKAKQADQEEYLDELRTEKRKQRKLFVPCFQLDAHLVGKFLTELGEKWNKSVLYGFDGKSKRNPKTRKDGTPYPSNSEPTNIFFQVGRRHITVHSWVLKQCGVTLEEGQHCHHIDGDITNNMLENLQVLSNVDHGRITIQEQRAKGILHSNGVSRRLTDEQVEEIRAMYKTTVTSIQAIADIYDAGYVTVYHAVYGLGAYSQVNPETRHYQRKKSLIQQISFDFGTETT